MCFYVDATDILTPVWIVFTNYSVKTIILNFYCIKYLYLRYVIFAAIFFIKCMNFASFLFV